MVDANGVGPPDMRPMVGSDSGNRPLWIGMAVIGILGLILFLTLNARRQTVIAPAVRAKASDFSQMPSDRAPPLYVPPLPLALVGPPTPRLPPVMLRAVEPKSLPVDRSPTPTPAPNAYIPSQPSFPPTPTAPQPALGPAIVYDNGDAVGASPAAGNTGTGSASPAMAQRARAGRLANRATIVAQGTLIAAVLETALDSTQPGQVRALVSRDVVNLIGDKVLIPRGSRLFGVYRGELGAGQNRANVQWARLVRPDGVTIDLDSPAADQLGRAGVRGQVDTHFLERLGGALLQSTLDFGALAASRAIDGGSVVIAVPGGQASSSHLVGQPPKPTLRVRQGTRIAVFVVRDLDFTGVEAASP